MKNSLQFQTVSFFILLAITLTLVAKVFLPYASVLLWAAILYIISAPLYHTVIVHFNVEKKGYHIKRRIIAGFFSVGIVLIVAGILFFFVIKLVGQGQILARKIMNFFTQHPHLFELDQKDSLAELVFNISMGTIDLSQFDIKKEVSTYVMQYTNTIVQYVTYILKNIGNFGLSLLFMSFALYFFYIDGPYLASLFITAIPIQVTEGQELAKQFKNIVTNLFKGFFLVSICQFVAALFVFLLFGIEGALLLAFLTFFSSFLPLVGCAIVWIPIGVELCISEGLLKGCLFLITAGIVISSLDNVLRPLFLQNRIHVHPLLIFFSILGGIELFHFNGIVLGPLFVILFFTLIDIARNKDNAAIE
ncbi:MAG: AI-2E family transporter [Treponema sp.]